MSDRKDGFWWVQLHEELAPLLWPSSDTVVLVVDQRVWVPGALVSLGTDSCNITQWGPYIGTKPTPEPVEDKSTPELIAGLREDIAAYGSEGRKEELRQSIAATDRALQLEKDVAVPSSGLAIVQALDDETEGARLLRERDGSIRCKALHSLIEAKVVTDPERAAVLLGLELHTGEEPSP